MSGFLPKTAGSGRCPCGGGPERLAYDACCGPLHRRERPACTAEQLMRSRFSAFALGEVDHLLRTHPSTEPEASRRKALQQSCRQLRWQRLEILASEAGGPEDLAGTVSFRAHYRHGNGRGVLQERSRFGRAGGSLQGEWLYLEALEFTD